MFTKRHRITLLFNANKAYDRQGIFTGVTIGMGYFH